jgi:hypothetical protein
MKVRGKKKPESFYNVGYLLELTSKKLTTVNQHPPVHHEG